MSFGIGLAVLTVYWVLLIGGRALAQKGLAPPLLSKRDPVTGELQKRSFGPWMLNAFKLLARMKGLRGGALDIFGKTEERRHERRMIEDYIKLLDEVASKLDTAQSRRRGAARQRARGDPGLWPREGQEHGRGQGTAGAAPAGFPQPAAGAAGGVSKAALE